VDDTTGPTQPVQAAQRAAVDQPAPAPAEPAQAVAAALAALDTVAERSLDEHPAVFEQIHTDIQATLRGALSDVDRN
jgi:hypothetical protein